MWSLDYFCWARPKKESLHLSPYKFLLKMKKLELLFARVSFPMDNGKRMKAIEVLQLPEPVIQHIQSFLSSKEAAMTAVLSKSWYNSWLTNPILEFNECDFPYVEPSSGVNYRFLNFVEKRMESYTESNLRIDSFKLLMMNNRNIQASTLVTESIIRAVKMGVHNLNIEFDRSSTVWYGFPKEVFESESLKMLFITGCSIDGISGENVRCSKLEKLHLVDVHLGDETFGDIMSRCPLIEGINMVDCHGNVDMSRFDCLSNVPVFHKLKYLVLDTVKIDGMLLHDFSTKFPCVEDLTVKCCRGCVQFDISSHSLKYVTMAHEEEMEVKFDVPNIIKFDFVGIEIPHFTFSRASNEWESDITFFCHRYNSWFGELKRFLARLSGSRISLSIRLPIDRVARRLLHFNDLPKPIFENLTIEADYPESVCHALLDAVFGNLRPKFVTQRLFPVLDNESQKPNNELPELRRRKANNKLLMFLCKKLMVVENNNGSSSSSSRTKKCWNNLSEVNAECFDETLMEWRPLPLKTLLDDIMIQGKQVEVRFQLKWGPPDGP